MATETAGVALDVRLDRALAWWRGGSYEGGALSREAVASPITAREAEYLGLIVDKDRALRALLSRSSLEGRNIRQCLAHLTEIRQVVGNISNDIAFLATLIAKDYLAERFGVRDYDAAAKAQGAAGPDIAVTTAEGATIRCEIKMNHPYQPGFGANQRKEILKDLEKLKQCDAIYKLMLVTDPDTFTTLCQSSWADHAASVEIVNLLTGEAFRQL